MILTWFRRRQALTRLHRAEQDRAARAMLETA
jgi:Rad3-related DNA helicase